MSRWNDSLDECCCSQNVQSQTEPHVKAEHLAHFSFPPMLELETTSPYIKRSPINQTFSEFCLKLNVLEEENVCICSECSKKSKNCCCKKNKKTNSYIDEDLIPSTPSSQFLTDGISEKEDPQHEQSKELNWREKYIFSLMQNNNAILGTETYPVIDEIIKPIQILVNPSVTVPTIAPCFLDNQERDPIDPEFDPHYFPYIPDPVHRFPDQIATFPIATKLPSRYQAIDNEHYVRPASKEAAEKMLDKYLRMYPHVGEAMVWGFLKESWIYDARFLNPNEWKNYFSWDNQLDSRFKSDFINIFTDMCLGKFSFSFNPIAIGFTFGELRYVYQVYVAHCLYVEINCLIPWRLYEYSKEQLEWLLHARYLGAYMGHQPELLNYFKRPGIQYEDIPFNFGYTERMMVGGSLNMDPYPIFAEVIPDDPTVLFSFLSNTVKINQAISRTHAISILSRWFQDNVAHCDFWGGWLRIASASLNYYPPLKMVIGPISDSEKTALLGWLEWILRGQDYKTQLPKNKTLSDLFEKNTNRFACDINAYSTIRFAHYPAYVGCHTSSGMMHWFLRCLNIPSKVLPFLYEPQPRDNYPNSFHKGIEIHATPNLSIVLEHMDFLYQRENYQVDTNKKLVNFYDPNLDLLSIYITKQAYDKMFNRFIPTNISGGELQRAKDFAYRVLYTSSFLAISSYVIDYWEKKEKNTVNFSPTDVEWVKLMVDLNTSYLNKIEQTRQVQFASQQIEQRINLIKQGIGTLWGTTLQSYKSGYQNWLDNSWPSKLV